MPIHANCSTLIAPSSSSRERRRDRAITPGIANITEIRAIGTEWAAAHLRAKGAETGVRHRSLVMSVVVMAGNASPLL